MRKFFLASVFVAAPLVVGGALAPAANAQLLNIVAFDDGAAINLGAGCVPTAGGVLTCSGSSTDFSSIIISANGVPVLTNPDLSAVTITAVRSATLGSHTLDVQVFQNGLPLNSPVPLQSSFTANDLIGGPFGPETLSTFTGGTINTLGAQLSTVTFPATSNTGSQDFTASPLSPFTADAAEITQTFTAPLQEADDSVELQQAVSTPEPTTLALFASGLLGLGFVARRRRR
jgi:hypothetical protein